MQRALRRAVQDYRVARRAERASQETVASMADAAAKALLQLKAQYTAGDIAKASATLTQLKVRCWRAKEDAPRRVFQLLDPRNPGVCPGVPSSRGRGVHGCRDASFGGFAAWGSRMHPCCIPFPPPPLYGPSARREGHMRYGL